MSYIHDDFMLHSDPARGLYHCHAAPQPIIDFHNHLNPRMIARNEAPATITAAWLDGDHYKWRAMRAAGIPESLITGREASDFARFEAWAATVPQTMRNPLYHWTHLELKRYFGIDTILKPSTARAIYDECNRIISNGGFGARDLLLGQRVEMVGTTDDPCDTLEYHAECRAIAMPLKVLPTWRPDRLMAIDNSEAFTEYVGTLSCVSDVVITDFSTLLQALELRANHFASMGCRASDHGLDTFYADDFTDSEASAILRSVLAGGSASGAEVSLFRSAMLYHLAALNHRHGWVQQFHIGPLRNNNVRLWSAIGPDIGCDSIGDRPVAAAMGRLLGRLDREGILAPTVAYNLNPKDTEVLATMLYNFNDGSRPGKMQYGAAWWFLDQRDGMTRQIEAISGLGLLSRFIGMLTDSRSFLSFTRHEYFRRLLCDILGSEIERGLLPASEYEAVARMVEDVSYHNAKGYFGL